jgi:hypothetical protein
MTNRPTESRSPGPSLDDALAAWATTEPAGAGDEAALARILGHADTAAITPARASVRWKPGWMVGGALAASLAVALLLAQLPGATPAARPDKPGSDAPVMLAEADGGSNAAFMLLYTPTIEEEYQL